MTTKFTWYGHATLGLETGGYKILVDPFFSGNPAASDSAEAVEADFILISHGHGDHVGDAVAIAQRTGPRSSASTRSRSGAGSRA